jgi:cysteine desulfurase/selenocysteine lyase
MIITRTEADLDIQRIRADFPILGNSTRGGRPLVYLDSAASAQKPRAVIDAESSVYETQYANIHRGLYDLSERATLAYEEGRRTVQRFLKAKHAHEIIFTRNATESINLVAASYGRRFLQPGDEIVITGLEHHSNIVPWQLLREERGVVLKVAPVSDNGEVPLEAITGLFGPRTRLVAVAHMSNVLGTILPVAEIIRAAHAVGAKVLVDGAQAVSHLPVDVEALDVDFYAFSAHKIYGPTGLGVLYGKETLLNAMPPYQGGGDMIQSVRFERSTWAPLPQKFEAGTPAIAQVTALAAAIDYVNALGLDRIAAHENALLSYATERLLAIPGLRIVGTVPGKAAVLSFILEDAHPHDIAQILDHEGVAVRAGHHCAQPLMERFEVPATARASFAVYNTRADVDALAAAVGKVKELFGR